LPCGVAHKIARDAGVPKIAVGEVVDRLGLRITNCQIGFFRVEKTVRDNPDSKGLDAKIGTTLETLSKNNELTCAAVFELAEKMKLTPMAVADVANLRNLKIRQCQLGCF
jgi:hypothetical protein